jgi:hypothetical protein
MIRHIVMFKLKEFSDPSEKQQAAENLRSELLSMRTKIPGIREFEIGINFNPNLYAFDVVINSVFETKKDLEIYQQHPAHKAFIVFNRTYSVEKVIVDYAF